MKNRNSWSLLVGMVVLLLNIPLAVGADSNLMGVGLNVANLEKSTAFYTEVFGMKTMQTYADDNIEENIMGFPEGGATATTLVLAYHKDHLPPPTKGARIIFNSKDASAIINKGLSLGATLVRNPEEIASLKIIVGVMRDLDGYLVEVVQAPAGGLEALTSEPEG